MSEPALFFADIAVLAPNVPRGIHSQTLYDGPDLRLVLFAFAPGEELSEHTAARPAVIEIVSGEADLVVAGEAFPGRAGTWVRMPPRTPHSIRATTPLVLLLTLLPAIDRAAPAPGADPWATRSERRV